MIRALAQAPTPLARKSEIERDGCLLVLIYELARKNHPAPAALSPPSTIGAEPEAEDGNDILVTLTLLDGLGMIIVWFQNCICANIYA